MGKHASKEPRPEPPKPGYEPAHKLATGLRDIAREVRKDLTQRNSVPHNGGTELDNGGGHDGDTSGSAGRS